MFDIDKIRLEFPILHRNVNDKKLVYLDNGASAQKPKIVIDAINRAYSEEYANVHRGLYHLSNLEFDLHDNELEACNAITPPIELPTSITGL